MRVLMPAIHAMMKVVDVGRLLAQALGVEAAPVLQVERARDDVLIDEALAEHLGLTPERAATHQLHLKQAIGRHLIAGREREIVVVGRVDVRDAARVDDDLDVVTQARKFVEGFDRLGARRRLVVVAGDEREGEREWTSQECAAKHGRRVTPEFLREYRSDRVKLESRAGTPTHGFGDAIDHGRGHRGSRHSLGADAGAG